MDLLDMAIYSDVCPFVHLSVCQSITYQCGLHIIPLLLHNIPELNFAWLALGVRKKSIDFGVKEVKGQGK
jgi:hypothetical protein